MPPWTLGLLLLLSSPAWSGPGATDPPAPEVAVSDIVGVARNGKVCAVLVGVDRVLHVAGVTAWPEALVGRVVEASGRVSREHYLPVATRGPDGEWAQGVAPGGDGEWVLRDAHWKLAGPEVGLPVAPWRVTLADGSGNTTKVWMSESDSQAHFEYTPVTPATSSSGTYSGGEPRSGVLGTEQSLAVWVALRTLEADPANRAERRELGTGAVSVSTGGAGRGFTVRRGEALQAFQSVLNRVTGGPP